MASPASCGRRDRSAPNRPLRLAKLRAAAGLPAAPVAAGPAGSGARPVKGGGGGMPPPAAANGVAAPGAPPDPLVGSCAASAKAEVPAASRGLPSRPLTLPDKPGSDSGRPRGGRPELPASPASGGGMPPARGLEGWERRCVLNLACHGLQQVPVAPGACMPSIWTNRTIAPRHSNPTAHTWRSVQEGRHGP